MKNPIVRTDAQLTFNLELDAQTVVDLEKTLSFGCLHDTHATPRVQLVLQVLKGLVYRMGDTTPQIAEFLRLEKDEDKAIEAPAEDVFVEDAEDEPEPTEEEEDAEPEEPVA
jgi:hypothetical protein